MPRRAGFCFVAVASDDENRIADAAKKSAKELVDFEYIVFVCLFCNLNENVKNLDKTKFGFLSVPGKF